MHAATRAPRAGRLATFACLGLVWSTPAAAQEPSVGDAADRPGFADSAVLAGRGHILFETGFTLAHDGDDRASARTLTWPQVELHGGLTSWLDLSVIWDGLVSARTHTSSSGIVDEDTTTGLDDFRVGVKVRLVRRPRLERRAHRLRERARRERRRVAPLRRSAHAPRLVAGASPIASSWPGPSTCRQRRRRTVNCARSRRPARHSVGHHRRPRWLRRRRRRAARLRLAAQRVVGRSGSRPRHRRTAPGRCLGRPPRQRRHRRLVHQRRLHPPPALGGTDA